MYNDYLLLSLTGEDSIKYIANGLQMDGGEAITSPSFNLYKVCIYNFSFFLRYKIFKKYMMYRKCKSLFSSQIAVERSFTKGRDSLHIAASCIYIMCR